LERASVLPNTYVAPGLYVRESVVDGTKLEHLAMGVSVDLGASGLSARIGRRVNRYADPQGLRAPGKPIPRAGKPAPR
jgi:hypothetical protein